jgi:hypothetical protein
VNDDEFTVCEFWHAFDILDCVWIVGVSWKELSVRLMNSCWKNSHPSTIYFFEGFDVFSVCTKIVIVGKENSRV